MKYELPKLSYSYNALEPYIDAQTMEIHYTKHHQAYIDKLNTVLSKYHDLSEQPLVELLNNLTTLPMEEKDKMMFKNNAGGHLNHTLFWEIMGQTKQPDQTLVKRISQTFGSIEKFKEIFTQTAQNHFGSGWAWLVENEKSEFQIYSTPNQDSPYLQHHRPIIGLDVWEHAYYLKYQNRRPEYITNWWNVLKLL